MKTIILHETYIGTQFPCALEYDNYTGLIDNEESQLDDWYSGLVNVVEDCYGVNNPIIHFEYGEQSEFETCDITGFKGDCVAVTVFTIV